MKKFSSVLLVALLVFAVVGQASAYFDGGNLAQVAYSPGDKEVAVDLGIDLATYNFDTAANDKVATGAINLSQFATGTTWADINLAYYGQYDTTNLYFATTKATAPSFNERAGSAFLSGVNKANLNFNTLGGNPSIDVTASTTGYNASFTSGGIVPGKYAGLNNDFLDGEANLAALGSVGYVDMYIYKFERGTRTVTFMPGTNHDYQGIVRLEADGDTIVNPSAVPIPGTVLLLISGFMGLIGIRRKNS